MATLDVWVTVFDGVVDTTASDLQRSQKIFAGVALKFRPTKHTLTQAQTQAILGTNGKLAISGGPTEFDHDVPAGVGSGVARPYRVQDPDGRFTTEVWAAVRDWSDLGGLNVFYVQEFDPVSLEGGICLRVGDLIDPIIFVSQKINQSMLANTKGTRGVLEHEIGHAFGLPDIFRAKSLMDGVLSSSMSDAGTFLSQDELRAIANSRLFRIASTYGERQ
jgi:hypothetical protein